MIWLLVANGHGARLLRGDQTRVGSWQLSESGTMGNGWEEHEHGRPSPRAGRSGHSYASWKHEDREAMRRYAKDLAQWMERRMDEFGVERLTLFAPARLITAMNGFRSRALNGKVSEKAADLCYMTAPELLDHPMVQQTLSERN